MFPTSAAQQSGKRAVEPLVVLITGSTGCLGSHLVEHIHSLRKACCDAASPSVLGGEATPWPDRGIELHGTWHRTTPPAAAAAAAPLTQHPSCIYHQCDLASAESVRTLFHIMRPHLVIHTAYTQHDPTVGVVDFTRNVVDCCNDNSSWNRFAFMVHISSDTVFSGVPNCASSSNPPYAEDAPTCPISAYGAAKAAVEAHVVKTLGSRAAVVRVSLILGLKPTMNSSSRWIIDALREVGGGPKDISLFVDEFRCPIGADDLAEVVWEIGSKALLRCEVAGEGMSPPHHTHPHMSDWSGVWHAAGTETLSRYAIALLLAAHFGLDVRRIRPAVLKDAVASGASPPRPADLRMSTGRANACFSPRPRGITQWLFDQGKQ